MTNRTFALLFDIECLVKILRYGWSAYFKRNIYKFEFILCIGSSLNCVKYFYDRNIFTYFQVFRLFRLIKASPMLEDFVYKIFSPGKKLGGLVILPLSMLLLCTDMTSLTRSSSQVQNVTVFFVFFMAFYAIMGIQLFGRMDYHCVVPGASVFTVYLAASEEGWVYVLYDCLDSLPSHLAFIYFVTLIFFMAWLVKNVFIAVITETFAEIRVQFSEMWQKKEVTVDDDFKQISLFVLNVVERLLGTSPWNIVEPSSKFSTIVFGVGSMWITIVATCPLLIVTSLSTKANCAIFATRVAIFLLTTAGIVYDRCNPTADSGMTSDYMMHSSTAGLYLMLWSILTELFASFLCPNPVQEQSSTPKIIEDLQNQITDLKMESLAGLLQVACKKVEVELNYFESTGINGLFRTECQFKDYIGVGISKNKKSSKHLAAREVLLHIVDTDDYERFGIPGEDKESAKDNINGLMPELQNLQNESLAGLLQCASKKVYGLEPNYSESTSYNGLFRTKCRLKNWSGVGIYKDKNSSRHLAARNVLLNIVDTDDHIRFGIPGHDKESAKTYILGLMPELQSEEVKSAPVKVSDVSGPEAQDWISSCNELCINRKVGYQPVYDFPNEEGPSNVRTFRCTATVNSPSLEQPLSVTATGRDKKNAMQMSAKELYPLIEQNFPALENDKKDMVPTTSSSTHQESTRKSAVTTPDDASPERQSSSSENNELLAAKQGAPVDLTDLKLALQQISSSESLYYQKSEGILKKLVESENPLVQKVFDTKEILFELADVNDPDNIQVSLEMSSPFKKATKNIFFGKGTTVEYARGRAAWQALQFLYTFGGFASEVKEDIATYSKELRDESV
ncbi:ion transport protein [Ditylenchus destructor]|nr:ion transport protein [Ditylenchus destructor]